MSDLKIRPNRKISIPPSGVFNSYAYGGHHQ